MDQLTVNGAIDLFKKIVTEHYADFNGRVGRRDFWTYVAVALALFIVVGIVAAIILPLLLPLLNFALLLPSAGMAVRRLHDVGKNGMIVLISFALTALAVVVNLLTLLMYGAFGPLFAYLSLAPIRGLLGLVLLGLNLYIIYLCAQPGVSGPNEYGPDPKSMM